MEMVSFEELKVKYKDLSQIPYHELLNTKEWKSKRLKIIQRDNDKCTDAACKMPAGFSEPDAFGGVAYNKNFALHVHHKYYVKGWLPWDFPENALITLCGQCHQNLHNTETIDVYRETGDRKLIKIEDLTICSRCSGSGYFYEYDHINNGVCFKCGGHGFNESLI